MGRVVEALCDWARRTSTSFTELRESGWRSEPGAVAEDGLVYRLREWPVLPPALRTAQVLRLLSLMSNRPVNRHWMMSHTGLPAEAVDTLLQRLVEQEAVEVIDTSRFEGRAGGR
jgi:hypothetical protein